MREEPANRRWFWGSVLAVLLAGTNAEAQLPGSVPAPEAAYDILGSAVYEKFSVTSLGLDAESMRTIPVRGAVVEISDLASGTLIGRTVTGSDGAFFVQVAEEGPYSVRVLALLDRDRVEIIDPFEGSVWSVASPARAFEPVVVRASEQTRVAGAFNILDTLRRANSFVRQLEPEAGLEGLTVLWSPFHTDDPRASQPEFVGGTWFDSSGKRAVVLGDRLRDSDEYDDDVILHEYAHYLADLFSGDDSIGGAHGPGDVLDPRVAWSEGWANFFSALVAGDPYYRDSRGGFGGDVLEYDLESNRSGSEQPGYWSERTVHSLLWDLVDDAEDSGESFRMAPGDVWDAFRRLRDDDFVYLVSFLDALVEGGRVGAGDLEQLARLHSLDYVARTADRLPSFPRVMDGEVATGELNSWSERRANLAKSAHFYTFYTSGGAVAIDLEVSGLGAARNPLANDLDLFLLAQDGQLLRMSGIGGNGEAERIATFLPAGVYVVEIRSFRADGTEGPRFNSGSYRLRVTRP